MVTIATITHKNQLTIPKEFIANSVLEGAKKVLLEKKNGKILVRPLKSKINELAGSLYNPKRKPLSRKTEKELVQKLVAQEIVKESL